MLKRSICLFISVLLIPLFAFAHPKETATAISPPLTVPVTTAAVSPFVQHLQNKQNLKLQDVTKKLLPILANPKNFAGKKYSHQWLVEYYQKNLRAFLALYPPGLFKPNLQKTLGPFSGKAELASHMVYFLPFIPISLEDYDIRKTRFHSLKTTFQGKTIYGIRLTTTLASHFLIQGLPKGIKMNANLPYIADINAVILGFTHGQFILPLSKNTIPAPNFDYNGLKKWSKHSRYSRNDQANKAIKLTNFAHIGSSQYLISSHPDFALAVLDAANSEAKMTFFLWKQPQLFGLSAPVLKGQLPDFVQEIVLKPVGG